MESAHDRREDLSYLDLLAAPRPAYLAGGRLGGSVLRRPGMRTESPSTVSGTVSAEAGEGGEGGVTGGEVLDCQGAGGDVSSHHLHRLSLLWRRRLPEVEPVAGARCAVSGAKL
jgi:hypothetical protein